MLDREQRINNFQAALRATGITMDVRTADLILRVLEASDDVGADFSIAMSRKITESIDADYSTEPVLEAVPE